MWREDLILIMLVRLKYLSTLVLDILCMHKEVAAILVALFIDLSVYLIYTSRIKKYIHLVKVQWQ